MRGVTLQHEQHRAFVIFHKTQAAALGAIEEQSPQGALQAIDEGLELIEENFDDMGWEDDFESDELVQRLMHLRTSLRSEFSIQKSLREAVGGSGRAGAVRTGGSIARRNVSRNVKLIDEQR